jgi:hypothetical protein
VTPAHSSPEYQRAWRARQPRAPNRQPGIAGSLPTHPCGTWQAYRRHRRHGEEACQPCKDANAARSRNYRKDHT